MANAAKHFLHYPKNELKIKPYFAFGFRPFFLIAPWYIVCISLLWGLNYGGVINFLPFLDPLSWHIYEMLYGLGFLSLAAFILTALPEFFAGEIPIVGRKLKYIVILWIFGRFSFWLMGIFGIIFAFILNVAFSVVILAIAFKPIVLDKLQRHSSIAYITIAITISQIMFFLSLLGFFEKILPICWLYLGLSFFVVLVLLALRRIQTEEINEFMEDIGIEEKFIARSYRYNLTIFCILCFCIAEFFMQNSILSWLGFACFAATLGIMNDFRLKYESVFIHPFVIFFAILLIFIAIGYLLLALSYFDIINELSYARHLLGIGGFAGSILVAMFIISFVHTGRKPKCDKWVLLSFFLLVLSVIIRYFVVEFGNLTYILASFFFSGSFLVYFFRFKNYLLNKRADGLPG